MTDQLQGGTSRMFLKTLGLLAEFPKFSTDEAKIVNAFGFLPFLASHQAGMLVDDEEERRRHQLTLCSFLALCREDSSGQMAAEIADTHPGNLKNRSSKKYPGLNPLPKLPTDIVGPTTLPPTIRELADCILRKLGAEISAPSSILPFMEGLPNGPIMNQGLEQVRLLLLADKQGLPLLDIRPFTHFSPGEAILIVVCLTELICRKMGLSEAEAKRQLAISELSSSIALGHGGLFRPSEGISPNRSQADGLWDKSACPAEQAIAWILGYA